MRAWPDLQIIHAIAATGSLAGAGRRLGIRHTTVGRRLDQIERRIGGKLVDRMPRGAVLTPLGRDLAGMGAEVDALMAAADRRARGEADQVAGMVSVSCPPLLAWALVPGMAALLDRHPALAVTIASTPAVASLDRNEADVALRLGEPSGPGLLSRRVGMVRLGLYGTPAMLARAEADRRFIGYDATLAHLPHHHWFERLVGDRPVAMRTNDMHAQREAAAAGIGIAMLPCALADADPRLGRLAAAVPPERPIWLMVHPDVRKSRPVGTVIEHLAALFGRDARFRSAA